MVLFFRFFSRCFFPPFSSDVHVFDSFRVSSHVHIFIPVIILAYSAAGKVDQPVDCNLTNVEHGADQLHELFHVPFVSDEYQVVCYLIHDHLNIPIFPSFDEYL